MKKDDAIFSAADILLPSKAAYESWAVIACDQFTSQPEYWLQTRQLAGEEPSTVQLILPEAELEQPGEAEKVKQINATMERYLAENILATRENAMIYVERTLLNGAIRRGLMGKLDLEAYDYRAGSVSAVRATEKTILERIPPRVRVRRGAALELPHVLVLCDDAKKSLIEPIAAKKNELEKVYDFELMQGGGHIRGWLLDEEEIAAFEERFAAYEAEAPARYADLAGAPMVLAVGDGNHSLATAKACYEECRAAQPGEDLSQHPARYALVELENIHDEAQVFEPIHRILTGVEPAALLAALSGDWCAEGGYPVIWYAGNESGTVYLNPARSQLTVGVLQAFLDEYLAAEGGSIDFIHGDETLKELAMQEKAIGFLLPAMEKSQLFRGVIADGALPRKTFSMGHAQEKRYYLEGRRIR